MINITRNPDASVTANYQHPRTGVPVSRTFIVGDTFGIVYERVGSSTIPVGRKLRRTTNPIRTFERRLADVIQQQTEALLNLEEQK
jgi:hypothetical protein